MVRVVYWLKGGSKLSCIIEFDDKDSAKAYMVHNTKFQGWVEEWDDNGQVFAEYHGDEILGDLSNG